MGDKSKASDRREAERQKHHWLGSISNSGEAGQEEEGAGGGDEEAEEERQTAREAHSI